MLNPAKEGVAIEFTGTDTSKKFRGYDDNAEVDVASGKAVAAYVPVIFELTQISLDKPENLPVQEAEDYRQNTVGSFDDRQQFCGENGGFQELLLRSS